MPRHVSLPGGRSLGASEADEALGHADGLDGAIRDLEIRLIQESLHKAMWNRSDAADLLKISRWTLQRKMDKYEIGKKR